MYMNIWIYTVHLFLYKCITCKVKSCLSNYCTFHISYVTTNRQKYKIASMKKYSWWTSCRSCWWGQRYSSTSHVMVSIAMHRGKSLLEYCTHPCNDQLWFPHMQHSWHPTEISDLVVYDHILSTSMLNKNSSIGFRNGEYGRRNSLLSFHDNLSKNGSDCAVGNLTFHKN